MSGRYFAALACAIVVLSIASAAFGQDAASAVSDPSMIPDLIDAGGQPAALLLLGWLIFGRGGLTIGIRLTDEDRAALKPDADLSREVIRLRERYHDLANKMAGVMARGDQ